MALGRGWCSGWNTKPCLTHLCLILPFAPWLLSHLLFLPSFLKKKFKKGEKILNFFNCLIYLECQIFGKKSLTTELMDHGAAFLAGGHRNYIKVKESEEGKPRANFHTVPGSSIFPLAAGLIIQLLGKKNALEREMS